MSFGTTRVTLASAVVNGGTVTVAYPSGTVQADYTGVNAAANTGAAILNNNDRYPEAVSGVRVNFTYNSGDVTVTNNTGVSWPAGSDLLLQFGRFGNDRPGITPSTNITSLTDNSAGTASNTLAAISGTYSQAEVRDSIASLAAKINQILATLRINGDIR